MILPEIGEVFQGKYKLQAILGRGGFAAVYRATDVQVGRDVAIKILAPDGEGYESDIVSRFLREGRVIASLQDPHTITMFDFGRTDRGLLFMVFEYVRGADLSDLLKKHGPLDSTTTTHILRQLLSALREAHNAGILHRDLKPANVLVYEYMGDRFRVKLLDFGIAKPVEQSVDIMTITKTGAVVGTPRYMSPEQICGNELTPAADLYCLGLIGYEMLVGSPAIGASGTRDILLAQLSDRPIRLPDDLEVESTLRRVVERMTARDARMRYQTAQEVLDDLGELGRRKRTTGQGPIDPRWQQQPATAPQPRVVQPAAQPVAPLPESPTQRETMGGPRRDPTSQTITLDGEVIKSAASNLAVVVLGVLVGAGAIIGVLSMLVGDDGDRREVVIAVDAGSPGPIEPEASTTGSAVPPAREVGVPAAIDGGAVAEVDAGLAVAHEDMGAEAEIPATCGEMPPFRGERTLVTSVRGVQRSWVTYVPKSYNPNRRHPIVLALHNSNESGSTFIQEFKDTSDREGFVVLAPTSLEPITAWKHPTDVDFMRRMVVESSKSLCLDRTRVYAVGHASGARMVERLLCAEVEFSAIASSGMRTAKRCKRMSGAPFMYLWGNEDRYLPRQGGVACNAKKMPSLKAEVDSWKRRNRCDGDPKPYLKHDDGECEIYSCSLAPYAVCEIDGGHAWSHGSGEFKLFEFPNCRSPGSDFPYAQKIWKFFDEKGRVLEKPFR